MLVRHHKAGDKIWVGEGYVEILELVGSRVKVGYQFPDHIKIHRDNPPVVVGRQRAANQDDCDVDTSVKSAPLKRLGSAIRDARLATGIDSKPATGSVRGGDVPND
jgi:hypothetical protein